MHMLLNLKNSLLWRYRLYSRKYSLIKNIILLIFIISSTSLFSKEVSSGSFYAVVTNISSQSSINPVVHYQDDAVEIRMKDRILPGATILTADDQTLEMIIYQGDYPYGIIFVMENTDFKFNFNDLTTILDVRVIYGGIRGVIGEDLITTINSQTVKSAIYGADFGLVSVINEYGDRVGYSIVFGGELVLASREDIENSEIVLPGQICEFEDYTIFPPRSYTSSEFYTWKPSMHFKSRDIPKNINLVLEYLDYEKPVVKEEIKKFPKFDYKKFVASFLSFKAGTMNYDNEIAIKFVWRPGASILGDKFEFGFYVPINFIPSKAFTSKPFIHIEGNNNEWSFGSDQGTNKGAIVFDAFSDVLSKIRVIRYNTIDEKLFVFAGIYHDLYDFNEFSLISFNSKAFYPKIRRTSFVFNTNFRWFQSLVYAEDILPKGLYGADLLFKTPAKSFRFIMRFSGFIDAYDLVKFDNKESFFPGQFNTTIHFDAFNVSSLGFSLYFSGGLLVPFSYNFSTGTSSFQTLMGKNPASLAFNIAANTGFLLRILDFNLFLEFIVDSGINKIGLFDAFYVATREYRKNIIASWIAAKMLLTAGLSDYNFGFRFRIKYNFLKYLLLESSYQLTFSGVTGTSFDASTNRFITWLRYYDKLYVKLSLDSVDRWKVNFSMYLLWQTQIIPLAFSSLMNFQLSNIIYTGLKIKTHRSVDINLAFGVYPDFVNFKSPWYSQFMFDFYITIKPLPFFEIKKEDSAIKNL